MRATLALAVLLGFGALTAEAVETGEFVVNSSPLATGTRPEAAMSAQGDALVVWGDDFDIRGRRFDRDGEPLGGDFQVGESFQEYLGPLHGAVDTRGFSVVWSDESGHSPGGSWFRRFGRQGQPLIDQTGLARSIGAASVDTDRRGNSVVVAVNGSFGVIGWRFDAQGRQTGPRFRVTGRGFSPQVTVDARGSFAVVWFNEDGIFARRFDAAANPAGPVLQVTARETNPRLAGNDNGSFVVAWQGDGIQARVYTPAGPRRMVTVSSQAGLTLDSVAMDAAGRSLVAWSCCGVSSRATQIFSRFLEPSGRPTAAPFQVSQRTDAHDGPVTAAAGPAGQFLVVWRREDPEDRVNLIGRYLEP